MTASPIGYSAKNLLERLDSIVAELQNLRREVESLLDESESTARGGRMTAMEILERAPGQRIFYTPDDVTKYLNEERASWES